MNYAVVAFLERRLNKTLSVFEYGSGYSTLFFARHARDVVSVEYDEAWYSSIGPRLPSNASLLFVPNDVDGDYCRAIARSGDRFDVVVVDGRDRVNCVKQSMQALSSRGVIVLDDSQREKYAPAISYAQASGYLMVDFEGLKPTDSSWCRSTILYRRENCLGL
jgi:predicted O-methyltransferase YrrM